MGKVQHRVEKEHALWVPIRAGLLDCGTYNEWPDHKCAARYMCDVEKNVKAADESMPAFAERWPVMRYVQATLTLHE